MRERETDVDAVDGDAVVSSDPADSAEFVGNHSALASFETDEEAPDESP